MVGWALHLDTPLPTPVPYPLPSPPLHSPNLPLILIPPANPPLLPPTLPVRIAPIRSCQLASQPASPVLPLPLLVARRSAPQSPHSRCTPSQTRSRSCILAARCSSRPGQLALVESSSGELPNEADMACLACQLTHRPLMPASTVHTHRARYVRQYVFSCNCEHCRESTSTSTYTHSLDTSCALLVGGGSAGATLCIQHRFFPRPSLPLSHPHPSAPPPLEKTPTPDPGLLSSLLCQRFTAYHEACLWALCCTPHPPP